MMLAGKHAPSRDSIEKRTSVAARDEHALALKAFSIRPLDCDAMRGVLARQPQYSGQASRSYLLQANETDTDQRIPSMELGPKRLRKNTLHNCRVSSEIDQQ